MADQNNEDAFLAEKVIDSGFGQQDGKRYYKIKWVRYSWESEDTIGHLKDLLDVFWSQHEGLDSAHSHMNMATKLTDDGTTELKETDGDIGKGNSLRDCDDIANGNLTANTTTDVSDILKTEEQANMLQNAHKDASSLNDGLPVSSINNENADDSITSVSSNQSDAIFDVDNKDGKYAMVEKHTCNVCLRTFTSIQAMKTHKKSHHSDKTFQCEHCFKSFSERSTLKRHMYIHLEEKPFKCEHCERAFSDKSTLRRHMITHTGAKRFHCTSCDKRFTRNEHLRQHNYIHTAQKLYKCEVCHKDFRQRSTLKNHMLLHRAEGGLTCEACGAVFSRQLPYDKHVHWCNGDTSEGLKCEYCDKRFPDRNGLKRHQVIHTGERPFKCNYCQQSFNDRSILRRHVFTHTERKPFQCSLCHKEFAHKSTLLQHISIQHTDQLVLEILQPTGYELTNGIAIEHGELEQNVSYVLQNTTPGDSINSQVEVCINDSINQNDGVTILADAVCNIPQGVMQDGTGNPPMVPSLNAGQDNVQHQDLDQQNENESLTIHMDQENCGIQADNDNHLLRVQIVRMEDGNDFIQSIQAIVTDENKDDPQTLPVNIGSGEELTIDNGEVVNAMSASLEISGSNDLANDKNELSCLGLKDKDSTVEGNDVNHDINEK